MKRMIQGLAAVVVAVSAFAFTPKADVFCIYEKSGSTCPLLDEPLTYTIQSGIGTRNVADRDQNGDCPASVTFNSCNKVITYTVD